ncbi:MAG: hypothetical protein UR39_C0011G0036 [Candidatus Woesebacteria bacterium GW2011_GWA1_33_30]|uniref:Transcriptional regulator, AbiEi antitoxin, Type IV TA system n=1 Tax=Candidatus Woesebacteria bacterium GW2011_GWA2_33_28 TaxID=1618561 RepID=A0A0F9ZQH6_9BACT|nr:MAG: hypothetical protein UR38_C0011G0034 [Candidatus Woesebacteria bacterium GW2011_GWA2_33_28]KKP47084.1 MAG: hypothetical protein UR39_C0011G0036 [Candidatus Woesebacteria bacterium GW2011_GWA1_33_30]KKP48698.1 MAG: hypothetical protein UR40_C0012G0034 [Microgenomates group bacterium GW2011_GWC1_33_32]KKP51407.1 MAG: hypothetical protein UR44_C0011G0034 [Candidatus Woesebacteria bacterium GW2011_GWB1_33_38]
MNRIAKLTLFKNTPAFNKRTLQRILDIKDEALNANVKRWLKKGELIQLKRGWYVTKDYYQLSSNKQNYFEWLANKFKEPSYLSMEYVLQKYNLLSEAVYSITSVTLKKTGNYLNNFGQFSYYNINDNQFIGYKMFQRGEYNINEATLAKALFDYLYYKIGKLNKITTDLWDDLRINTEVITDGDKLEFIKYCGMEGSKKMKQIAKLLI